MSTFCSCFVVPINKGEDRPCTTFYRNGYREKDARKLKLFFKDDEMSGNYTLEGGFYHDSMIDAH